MSEEDYQNEARKNYEASQLAYNTLKSKARLATSVGISKSVPQTPRISDEVQISKDEYDKQAVENYIHSKKAYKAQLTKLQVPTQFSAPPVSRPPSSISKDSFAAEAKMNYALSKRAYKDQMQKTRKATGYVRDEDIPAPTPRISDEEFAAQAKANYESSKQAYRDMLERQ